MFKSHVMFMTKMAPSHQISTLLWDVEELELHAMDVNPTNLHQLQDPIQYGPTFLKNAFSTFLNQCHVELRQF